MWAHGKSRARHARGRHDVMHSYIDLHAAAADPGVRFVLRGGGDFVCFLAILALGIGVVVAAPSAVSAQIPHVIRPDLEPPGADPVPTGETLKLLPSEERRLLQQILWQPEEQWDPAVKRAMEELLGKGRVRRLDEARFQLHLATDDWDLRNLSDDDYTYERTKDAVLSSYLKIQREILEDAFRVEERFDAWLDRASHRDEQRDGSGPEMRSYRVRISPRFSAGSSEYMGLKFRMPYTGLDFFSHFSMRVRHHFDDDRTSFILKYDDDDIFLNLELEPNTPHGGDEAHLSLKFWF